MRQRIIVTVRCGCGGSALAFRSSSKPSRFHVSDLLRSQAADAAAPAQLRRRFLAPRAAGDAAWQTKRRAAKPHIDTVVQNPRCAAACPARRHAVSLLERRNLALSAADPAAAPQDGAEDRLQPCKSDSAAHVRISVC